MPRVGRLHIPGGLYHVMGRGLEKRRIFNGDDDKAWFLDKFGECLNRARAHDRTLIDVGWVSPQATPTRFGIGIFELVIGKSMTALSKSRAPTDMDAVRRFAYTAYEDLGLVHLFDSSGKKGETV